MTAVVSLEAQASRLQLPGRRGRRVAVLRSTKRLAASVRRPRSKLGPSGRVAARLASAATVAVATTDRVPLTARGGDLVAWREWETASTDTEARPWVRGRAAWYSPVCGACLFVA